MKKIIIIAIVLIGIAGLVWKFTTSSAKQQVSKLDAIDTVGEYYDQWLLATREPAQATPDRGKLAASPILSHELRTRLTRAQIENSTPDPVLCQTTVPQDITIRSLTNLPDEARVLVTSKDKTVTEQAVITLLKLDEGWYINDIECSPGEFEPEREFTFEKEGYLLKDSVPAPYNSKNWHLVFEENGEAGHVVPLFFDAESKCADSVCKPENLTEAMKVFIRGQMSERGVSVKHQAVVK